MDTRTKAVIKAMGLVPVIWNAESSDTMFNSEETYGNITINARQWTNGNYPDGILSLQHDLFLYTARAIPEVLDVARAANKYQIVPLSECLNKQNVGPVYATSGNYYDAVLGTGVLKPTDPGLVEKEKQRKNSAAISHHFSTISFAVFSVFCSLFLYF